MAKKKKKMKTCYIQELPEDLLIKIVTLLGLKVGLKQLVRTSIISSRWRNLWKYVPNLVLNDKNVLPRKTLKAALKQQPYHSSELTAKIVTEEMSQEFIANADSILRSHYRLGSLQSLVVKFFLNGNHAMHLDAWVSIAVASRTKKLILSLRSRSRGSPYVFPCQQLLATQGKGEESFLEVFKLKFCDISIPATPDFDAFKNLRLLKFTSVNVTDEVVRDLLPRCAALNSLQLVHCRLLRVLEIPSSLCKLQFLKVARCRNLRAVECNAPSVSRFKYQGYEVSLNFNACSMLEKACIQLDDDVEEAVDLSLAMPSLTTLELDMDWDFQDLQLSYSQATFTRLKHLKLSGELSEENIRSMSFLINAAPFIETFYLCIDGAKWSPSKRIMEIPPGRPHDRLKTITMVGFSGRTSQLELLSFLLTNAEQLEVLTICPSWNLRPRQVGYVQKIFDETILHQIPKHVELRFGRSWKLFID